MKRRLENSAHQKPLNNSMLTFHKVGGKRGFLAKAEPQLHLVRGGYADLDERE